MGSVQFCNVKKYTELCEEGNRALYTLNELCENMLGKMGSTLMMVNISAESNNVVIITKKKYWNETVTGDEIVVWR